MTSETRPLAIVAAFAAGLLLTACEGPAPSPEYAVNQVVRAERFDACMKLIPPGPSTTTYNDWAEVVDECSDAAYYQAKYCIRNCEWTGITNPLGGPPHD